MLSPMAAKPIQLPLSRLGRIHSILARRLLNDRIWGPDGDRAWWLIPTFGVLLIALMWIGVLERGTTERAMVIDAAKKSIDGVAATFEQRTLRTIKNADVTALLLKYQFEESGQVDIGRAMARGIIPANAYDLVSIANARGIVVASSDPTAMGAYVGDRADFRYHAAIDTGCRLRATATVDRYAAGITKGKGLIGRYLDITLDIRATPAS